MQQVHIGEEEAQPWRDFSQNEAFHCFAQERTEVQRCDLLKDEKPLGDQESEPKSTELVLVECYNHKALLPPHLVAHSSFSFVSS